ncbi:MAG: flagellar basal body-associated FliL family protein [Alphaproteobacteria bacterium]|nr:flagellar basal body-associated FliL family protein [Alphaproteobacteria bacterium]
MTDEADDALEATEAEAPDLDDDGAESPEGGAEQSGGKRGKKLMLLAAIGAVVLIGAGAGVYFSGLLGGGGASEQASGGKGEAAPLPPIVAHYLDLEDMVVTLGGTGRKSSFLKLRVSLELENAGDESRIKAVLPRIVDNFQVFLRELRIEELQGSHGLYRVKEELLARVNAAVHPTKVRDVLFREMLVQ